MSARRLIVGAGAARFNWLPVFVAERTGGFAKRDLEIEIVRTGAVDKATAAVLSGDIDLAITPPEGAIRNAINGGGLRVIAGNTNALPLTLVASARFPTIESLRGARLGTSSLTEGTALYTMEMLRAHGLEYPADYEFVIAGVHPARWAALQDGTIDAAVQPAPLNFIAIDQGYTDLGEVSDYVPSIVFTAMIVDAFHAQQKVTEIVAFMEAVQEATEFIYNGTDDALLIDILAEIGEADGDYAQRAVDYMRSKHVFPRTMEIPNEAFETSVRLMVKANVITEAEAANARRVLDSVFLDAMRAAGSSTARIERSVS
ncbi:ABC transporter substrate-binding protein [Leifsonia kafniensis]|uniref:ABC transporter substrate-binding protein n=1 Tax=Leifsonia kafniensis TaxID=475957 RepID=A0ABP7KQ37_9MICO